MTLAAVVSDAGAAPALLAPRVAGIVRRIVSSRVSLDMM